jgi:hypothetical protein
VYQNLFFIIKWNFGCMLIWLSSDRVIHIKRYHFDGKSQSISLRCSNRQLHVQVASLQPIHFWVLGNWICALKASFSRILEENVAGEHGDALFHRGEGKNNKKKHKRKISAENRYQTAYRTPFTEVVLNYMRCYMVLIYIAIWFQYTSPGHTKAGCGRQPACPLWPRLARV